MAKDALEKIKEDANIQLSPYSIEVELNDGEIYSYHNIMGYQVNQYIIAISMTDGSTYCFPLSGVRMLAHYITPEDKRIKE